ncbi:MAG: hypothetical protein ABSF34_09140 [Verrucomicrobiota bacterium]
MLDFDVRPAAISGLKRDGPVFLFSKADKLAGDEKTFFDLRSMDAWDFPKVGVWNGVLLPFPAFLLSLFYPAPVACPGFAPPHPGVPPSNFQGKSSPGFRPNQSKSHQIKVN